MEYLDYFKKVFTTHEMQLMEECYTQDSINGLRINLIKSNTCTIGNLLNLHRKHPFINEAFIIEDKSIKYGKNPLHHAGAYYLQEPSAMMVAHLLGVNKGDKVLDLCAAPGGKSSQVLSYLNGSGVLVSNDISFKRAQVLSENIERMGAKNVYVLNEPLDVIEEKFYGYFDKVILDAPCSGQGMFRKNKEVLNDWTYNKTLSLANTNKELIVRAYNCLKKEGVLVYSTCTFTNEENEEVIQYLLDNTNASIIKIPMSEQFVNSTIDGAIRLYPFKFSGEGHFICLIQCNDIHEVRNMKKQKEAGRQDIALYKEFEKKYLTRSLQGSFIKMGDELHLLDENLFTLDKLKVLRNGLHLGTIKKDRFEPNHALAMYLKADEVKNSIDFDYTDSKIVEYLHGLTIDQTTGNRGYVLVSVNGISIGWGKDDGRIIKNLYPKGLRIN